MIRTLKLYGTLIGFVSILVFFAVQLPDTFLTARNLLNITQQVSMLAVVACSMTLVMVMRDFDLSVGSMASLAGIVAALLFSMGYPIWVGIAAALLVGVLGGVFNGILVSFFGILPFVATLGTLTMFSGMAFFTSGGKTIFGRDIPTEFSGFARSGIELDQIGLIGLKLPYLSLVALLVLVVVWFILEQTIFGRRLYAIGGNQEAARLAGLKVRTLRLCAFAMTGFGAAIAGLMYASRVASANPTQGSGLMLDAIAAVFLGMTMSEEGEPRVLYSLIGVLILGILDNGLTQMSVDSYIREILVGAIIVTAVAFSSISKQSR
ncbi:ABC transporter permease [Pararhizobium sp. IMCC21322]|uniref:ABC transporter permease n=1 Tax=Pararhizobium sp. IMCC21322 TaxID=3067903 RepID=UPI0027406164|nr:ABC transporter permease [Pararhizobium sp. IMCC21322]